MIDFKASSLGYTAFYQVSLEKAAQKKLTARIETLHGLERELTGNRYRFAAALMEFYKSRDYAVAASNEMYQLYQLPDYQGLNYCKYRWTNHNSAVFFGVVAKEFGIEKSAASRMMNVVDEFGDGDALKAEWQAYHWSALCELLSIPAEERAQVKPDWTIAQIRALKKALAPAKEAPEKEAEPEEPVMSEADYIAREYPAYAGYSKPQLCSSLETTTRANERLEQELYTQRQVWKNFLAKLPQKWRDQYDAIVQAYENGEMGAGDPAVSDTGDSDAIAV